MKPCDQQNEKANNPLYICNPQTGRWVKKDGAIGKKLVEAELQQSSQKDISTKIKIPIKKQIIPLKKIAIKEKQTIAGKSTIEGKSTIAENLPLPEFKLIHYQSIYYLSNEVHSSKLAVFDLDGTLIETQSGKTFADSSTDWKFLYDSTQQTLKKYASDGYKIIVISNQSGLSNGKTPLNIFSDKLKNIINVINIPIEFYVSSEKDSFRKPMTDIWNFLLKNNNIQKFDKDSFYCGDAAGRPKNYLPGKAKDFNITDRYFAYNIGLKFYTPEEFFLHMDPFKYIDIYQTELNLQKYYPTTPFNLPSSLSENDKNVIIMVGPQASGKSTLSKSQLYEDYVYLNNDSIKSMTKLNKLYQEALNKNNNVIIDNTNPSPSTRKYYIDLAKENNYKVYCYFFDFPKILSIHLNQMRVQITHGKHLAIPIVAIHTYYKQLVKPQTSEGIDEIVIVDKLHLPIENPIDFDLYYNYHYDLSGK